MWPCLFLNLFFWLFQKDNIFSNQIPLLTKLLYGCGLWVKALVRWWTPHASLSNGPKRRLVIVPKKLPNRFWPTAKPLLASPQRPQRTPSVFFRDFLLNPRPSGGFCSPNCEEIGLLKGIKAGEDPVPQLMLLVKLREGRVFFWGSNSKVLFHVFDGLYWSSMFFFLFSQDNS